MRQSRVAFGAVFVALTVSTPVISRSHLAFAGGIAGRVIDSGGGVLPGVAVTVVSEVGGTSRETQSRAGGLYQVGDLPDGTYRIYFDLAGFDVVRRNRVVVSDSAVVVPDVTLPSGMICQCVEVWAGPGPNPLPRERLRDHDGQVVDESDRPIPYAMLAVVSPVGREIAHADRLGRFAVRVLVDKSWPLTVWASGYRPTALSIAGTRTDAILIRLTRDEGATQPAEERFAHPCCPSLLFPIAR